MKKDRPNEYSRWKTDLELVLKRKFGISINDCLDESELVSSFRIGESPQEVAEHLQAKRGLTDLNDL